jgi:hypothetical protein
MSTESDTPNASSAQAKQNESPQRASTNIVRQKRVDQFEEERLNDPDHNVACLGAVRADLFRMSLPLGYALQQLLADAQSMPEIIVDLENSMNLYLRLTKQNERLYQLELRQTEQARAAERQRSSRPGKQTRDTREPHKPVPK